MTFKKLLIQAICCIILRITPKKKIAPKIHFKQLQIYHFAILPFCASFVFQYLQYVQHAKLAKNSVIMFLVYSNCFYTHFIFYARGHATLENVIEAIYDGCVTIDIKQFGSKAMSVLVKCFIRPARRCTFLTQNTNVRYINSFTD